MVIRKPEAALAIGERRRSGSNRMPAPMAEVEFTVCNLCGMLKMAAMKGNPVRKPLLHGCSQRLEMTEECCTHTSNPKTNLFTASLQGNMGSQTESDIDSSLSHVMKPAHRRPDKMKLAMTAPLFQG